MALKRRKQAQEFATDKRIHDEDEDGNNGMLAKYDDVEDVA
jgi:hypothetical protein